MVRVPDDSRFHMADATVSTRCRKRKSEFKIYILISYDLEQMISVS